MLAAVPVAVWVFKSGTESFFILFSGVIMPNPELIALLTAGSAFFKDGDRQTSSVVLTRSELAGYLAGLTHGATLMAYAKWGQDEASLRNLIAWVRVVAMGMAIEQQWPIERGKPIICNLAAIATYEVVMPMVHDVCEGRGHIGFKACPGCNGTGRKLLTSRAIQEASGVERMAWRRHWEGRYRQIVRAVADLDAEVQRGGR
jgi:hypothetical protein